MTANPTVAALLAEGAGRLRASSAGMEPGATPELDAQLLLAHVLGVPRAHLHAHPEAVPEAALAGEYHRLLVRRGAGEPLAYLTGRREFWSLELTVTPAVLIPRPETELLVERALALRPATSGCVADLGTGSGAVALALASERPRWRIVASDASADALAVARANAAALGLTLELRLGHWYEPLAGERFDLIVSNPPYVACDDPALASPALAHEPRVALTPGADALACLEEIVRGAPRHLTSGGCVLLEHGPAQAQSVRSALVLAGFGHVRSERDLAGHERVTEGRYDPI
jgi:release factor glutamine methyltransferase